MNTEQNGDNGDMKIKSLSEESKWYFDSIEVLRGTAWKSFSERRSFEWKLSFGIWTALALSNAGLAADEASLASFWERVLASLCALLIVVVHGGWAYYLDQVNQADLQKSYVYETQQMLFLGFSKDTKPGAELFKIIDRMNRRPWYEKRWGHLTQVAITAILVMGVIALSWLAKTK